MIRKEKLVKGIDAALDIQKKLLPLLNRHVSSSITLSGLPGAEKEEISRGLQNMAVTQAKHMEILSEARRDIEQAEENVY